MYLDVINFQGFFRCKSMFGEYSTTCNMFTKKINSGLNLLYGDIDSGAWSFSYVTSMASTYPDDVIFSDNVSYSFNGKECCLYDINEKAIYLDKELFANDSCCSVENYVKQALKESKSSFCTFDIQTLFNIPNDYFCRPIKATGNQFFKCIAAIGVARGKSIFCFPWISKKMNKYYGNNVCDVLKALNTLACIVLLPSNANYEDLVDNIIDFSD